MEAIDILKKHFDYIVLDTAPIGMVTDTQIIARVADLSVYVCRADYTHKADYTLLEDLRLGNKLPQPVYRNQRLGHEKSGNTAITMDTENTAAITDTERSTVMATATDKSIIRKASL